MKNLVPTISPEPKQHLAWQKWLDKTTRFILFGGGAGGGKIVGNDGMVLTPFGWKKGKELKTGDLINNPDGSIQRIIQIKPEITLPLWRVYFSDGTSTEVAEDHLWLAWKGSNSRKVGNKEIGGEKSAEVVETRKLKEWIERGYSPQIPVCKEQSFNRNARLKFDRYFLGAYIGDGYSGRNELFLTCSEEDKNHYKEQFGHDGMSYVSDGTVRCIGEKKKRIIRLLKGWGLFDKRSGEKFVPKHLLFDSTDNRYALAQGLMDTDGYSAPKKNGCYYYTVSEQLAKDVAHLLRSLGAVVTITKNKSSYKKNGKKIECKDCYDLYIKHRNPDSLFRMKRKRQGFNRDSISKRIERIEINGKITGRCITVSNPNGLYVTNDFIVTHNSWWICEKQIVQSYQYPGIKSFIARKELKRLMQSTYITFQKVLQFHKIPRENFRLDGKYNFIENITNGSRIDLLDIDYLPSDPLYERLGSLEYTNGDMEEAGESRFEAFDILKSRVGRHRNEEFNLLPKIGLTCNPSKGYLYRIFYKPWKEGRLPEEYAFIQSLFNDNKYTADIYGKQLAQITDQAQKERLMFGNWEYDDDPNILIGYDAILDLFTNPPTPGEEYITADIARFGKDRTVIGYWAGYDLKEITVLIKRGVDDVTREIRDLSMARGVPRSHVLIDEDGIGGGVKDMLPGSQGFIANSSAFEGNFKNLKAECSYRLADTVNSRKLSITARCTEANRDEIIEDLGWIRSKDSDKDAKKQVMPKDEVKEHLGRSTDFGDMIMMRMWFDVATKIGTGTTSSYTPKLREHLTLRKNPSIF